MTLQPHGIAELQEAVRAHDALTIRGAGTKSAAAAGTEIAREKGVGTEVRRGRVLLDTTALTGVTDYSPDECVFTAWAGTALAEIHAVLAAHGQCLPFDPPLVEAGATIGGTVAAGVSGSGRYRYGGVRDFVIGARIVDGEGRLIRSGGKVVKNAAGFLLHHAMVGSLGRFGVLAEITFKVFPAPESRRTLRVQGHGLRNVMDTLHEVEKAQFDLAAIDFDETGTLLISVSGRADTVALRIERLKRLAPWTSEVLDGAEDERFWSDAREFRWAALDSALVKIPVSESARLPSTALRAGKPSPATVPSPTVVRYTCGGKCMWVAALDLNALSEALSSAGLRGQVIRGERAGTIIGSVERNAFEERVRSVLDPRRRFSASRE
ncbi:MAG: FAD-binding protein [Vicinamibacterales bacterium]